ncbi:MAG TPA: ABC transporter permease [Thermoanaerobaculaceae bacterium]|nr:ABC transporter permease [Thermoanaerobaculaceae bacterium]
MSTDHRRQSPITEGVPHDTAGSPPGEYLLVLEPRRAWAPVDLAEIWRYRDLLYFLTKREISIRYKQTALGVAWAFLQPFLTMIVFTVFLGHYGKMDSQGLPYPVFCYLGLLPWTYFANALTRASSSLVGNANLLTKVYFPRLLVPLSATLSALVDFAIAAVLLVGLMLFYGVPAAWSAVLLLPLTVATALIATGVGMWLAALNVRYRDVQHAIPFVVQIWMFLSPVVYPARIASPRIQALLTLNPMTGLIGAYRSAALGWPIDWRALSAAGIITVVASAFGLWQFRRMERSFADVV